MAAEEASVLSLQFKTALHQWVAAGGRFQFDINYLDIAATFHVQTLMAQMAPTNIHLIGKLFCKTTLPQEVSCRSHSKKNA